MKIDKVENLRLFKPFFTVKPGFLTLILKNGHAV